MPTGAQLLQALAQMLFGRALQQPAPAPATAPAPADAAPAAPASPWQPLPGNVLELGATGYQIQMDVSPKNPLYTLRAPEGWIVAYGVDLAGLKAAGERFASERAEFVCKPIEARW